ncbi:MAG: sensor domain-containing diguanylate cyclase [Ilumatobacter sp.]|uniref:GGDEF domain-containing protein n=1 Tax=Ilumatobacter sp. TaxID=1967498 RepID=UPI003C730F06
MWSCASMSPVELLDTVPTGILIIDRNAAITEINDPAARILGGTHADLVGRTLYELAHPDDLEFAVDLIGEGTGYGAAILGPIRIRYRAIDGTSGTVEIWSRELADIGGWVLVLTEQSTSNLLNDVTSSVAAGDPIETTMSLAVEACAAHPIRAQAAIVLIEEGGLRRPTEWPFGPFDQADATSLVAATVETMRACSYDVESGDPTISITSRTGGAHSLWTYPIVERDAVVAVLVLLRDGHGPPTTNQDRHLARLVSVAELAFSQATHRRSREVAAMTDALTGLGNRTRLDELTAADLEFGAAIYIDLDGFKQVNDELGHAAGDNILRTAARRIAAAVRADDVSVRMGGDEFVIVVAERDAACVEAIAHRLVDALAKPIRVTDDPDTVTSVSASIGVCRSADAHGLRDGIARADAALLQAKTTGKNRWIMA